MNLTAQEVMEQEKRMDSIEAEVHKQSGWLKTSGFFIGCAVAVLSWFGTAIDSKLNAIQAMLTDSKVVMMQHSEQIKVLGQRITAIEERHLYLDQNGMVKKVK